MSASARTPTEDTLLLAATAAALARRGWPAAKTAGLLAEALPHGPERAQLAMAADALSRGESLPSKGELTTSALLARGEVAGAESLAELAHAHALELRAKRLAAAGIAYSAAGLAFGAMLVVLGDRVARTTAALYVDLGATSNAAIMAQGILSIAKNIGWILAIVSAVGVVAAMFGRGFLPGVTSMRAASRLRRVAAALAGGVPERDAFALAHPGAEGFGTLDLKAREHALALRLAAIGGAESAARSLGEELERDAREASRLWRLVLPYAGVGAMLAVLAVLAISLLAPVLLLGGMF